MTTPGILLQELWMKLMGIIAGLPPGRIFITLLSIAGLTALTVFISVYFQKKAIKNYNNGTPALTSRSVMIPGVFKPRIIVFSSMQVEIDGRPVQFMDITGINFYIQNVKYKGSDSTTYFIVLRTETEQVTISFSNFFIKNEELKAIYKTLVWNLYENLIPMFVKKTVNGIFSGNTPFKIGNITMYSTGYEYKWLLYKEHVPWKESLFIIDVQAFEIKLLRLVEGRMKFLTAMRIETMNSALLSDIAGAVKEKAAVTGIA